MLTPTAIGKVIDTVPAPAVSGVAFNDLRTPIIVCFGAIALLYVLANIG